jgi:preprotein translocase subunit SecD
MRTGLLYLSSQINSVNIKLLATALLVPGSIALAADSSPFELRAVADAATDETSEHSLAQRDGGAETVLLHSAVLLDRTALKGAALEHEPDGTPRILITLTGSGAARFGDITTKHLGKRLGIILDGRLHSAPVIRDTILGGSVALSGRFTEAEATELVKKLNQSVAK